MTHTMAREIFALMEDRGCREITFHRDPDTGLRMILVVDSLPGSTGRGLSTASASGGTRWAHTDPDIALQDALLLARAMTRKARVLESPEGGAKAVVLRDGPKTESLLNAIGDAIAFQHGRFRTAIDLGFTMEDAERIALRSPFIDSLSHVHKGLGSTGENTARGMVQALHLASAKILGKPLMECSIAIQGLGAVGLPLARELRAIGCAVIGADIDPTRCDLATAIGVEIIPPDRILVAQADILAPCAFGGVIGAQQIDDLKCRMIASGANNPLLDEMSDEKLLRERGIVFLPDFIINAGGFLQAIVEREGGTIEQARARTDIIPRKLNQAIDRSRERGVSLLTAALELHAVQHEEQRKQQEWR